MSESIYEQLARERKQLQAIDLAPAHWSTASYQLFKEKYMYEAENPREQYERIAKTLAKHTPDPTKWEKIFFDMAWKGWISLSTPVLANVGTDRGMPISCAGNVIPDSIYGIYTSKRETAMLTKMGFGTSSYIGDVRARGTPIFGGGKSSGVMPVIEGIQNDMNYVSQGTARRGSWAAYLPIDHDDFYEVCANLEQRPDGNNIGWNVSNDFLARLESGDEDAIDRYAHALKCKCITGKGYFWFTDKANAVRPECYKTRGLEVKHSNLCSEIALFDGKYAEPDLQYRFDYNDRNYIEIEPGKTEEHTFTCVLSSVNLAYYDDWKDTDLIFNATVMLDCVTQEFIDKGSKIKGLESAVRFTKKSRALGLGVCGLHTLFQKRSIPFGSLDAHLLNNIIFKELKTKAEQASKWLAETYGESLWTKGTGRANTHLIAIAPTKSSSLLVGGVSEGINPDLAMVFTQRTAGGEIDRINPVLLDIMKERGKHTPEVVKRIRESMGSVQQEDWLDEHEKRVFLTAFEINQHDVLRLASSRAKYICQWQSLNVFFPSGTPESYINAVHKEAFSDPNILGLYYMYSQAGVQGATGDAATDKLDHTKVDRSNNRMNSFENDECIACE